MITITITSRQAAGKILCSPQGGSFSHLISIGEPDERPPAGFGRVPRRLRLTFDDIERYSETCPWYVPCPRGDVQRIINFCQGIHEEDRVLIHCGMGVSRSSAAALILLVMKLGVENPVEAIRQLLSIKRTVQPNRRMVWIADEMLGCEGRLVAAYQEHFRHLFPAERGEPDTHDKTGETS